MCLRVWVPRTPCADRERFRSYAGRPCWATSSPGAYSYELHVEKDFQKRGREVKSARRFATWLSTQRFGAAFFPALAAALANFLAVLGSGAVGVSALDGTPSLSVMPLASGV